MASIKYGRGNLYMNQATISAGTVTGYIPMSFELQHLTVLGSTTTASGTITILETIDNSFYYDAQTIYHSGGNIYAQANVQSEGVKLRIDTSMDNVYLQYATAS